MGSELIDGAILMGTGIAVVFAVLVILIALISLQNRVFPEKGQEPVPTTTGMESIVTEEGEAPPEADVVAAIALALSLAQSEAGRPRPKEGAPRAHKPNPWTAYGRQQIMDSRGRARKQW
jgi:sodium pump decarboxylase gamma subunit